MVVVFGEDLVELVSFSAGISGGSLELRWETASEDENLGFNVYRATSLDGNRSKITPDMIEGAGTTIIPQTYSFLDADIAEGRLYVYWLEQVDFSGAASLYGPISVSIPTAMPENLQMSVAPIPSTDGGTISLVLPSDGRLSVAIYDLQGRRVKQLWHGSVDAGSHTLSWSRGELGSGVYVVRATTTSGSVAEPILLK